jgi:hypothetical protein
LIGLILKKSGKEKLGENGMRSIYIEASRLSLGRKGPGTFGSDRNDVDPGKNEPQLRMYRLLNG